MGKIQTFGALLKKAGLSFKSATKVATTQSGTSIFNVALKNGGTAQYTVGRCGNQLSQAVSELGGKQVKMITERLDDVGAFAHTKTGKSIVIPGTKVISSIRDTGRVSPVTYASIQKTTPTVDFKIANGKPVQKINYGVETHADELMGNVIMPTDSHILSNDTFQKVFQREPKLDVDGYGARLGELIKTYG